MHILVTDATGALGRLVAGQLIAAGHTVSGIAELPHPCLDRNVEFVCASLRDRALRELTDEADAVIHLAPIDPSAPGSAGMDGLARVTDAAARAGSRLLFVSQAAGRPELYRPAEDLVSSSWGPTAVIRIAPPVGRQLDWMVCRTVATLLRSKVSAHPMRVLHLDDLMRFLVLALNTDRTGVVDLASPDTVNMVTAWRVLRAADPRSRPHRVRSWALLTPELDVAAAQEDWMFSYGWHALDAVADTARGLVGRRLDTAGAINQGGQLALPVEVLPHARRPDDDVHTAAPEGLEGEFDDQIDARFPVFSAAALAEALPGPLTPITLDVQLSGLRAASRVLGQVLALGGVADAEWGSRAIAVFGHRPYVGVSVNMVAASQLPGWDQDAVAHPLVGQPQVGDPLPFGEPAWTAGALGSVAKAVAAGRSVALLRHLRADTRAYCAAAAAEHLDATQLALLPEAALEVRLRLLRDRIHQGWILNALWLIDSGVTAAALVRSQAGRSVPGMGMITDSGLVAAETAELASMLRADPPLAALAAEGNLASIRALSPKTAAALDAVAARIGHRGPGEAELASTTFDDDPTMLLTAAAAAAPPEPAPATLAERVSANARGSRELAHDTTMRFTHELRMTLRALGSLRVEADLIDAVDDMYYLTCNELVTMPGDARLRIKRRRTERERLQAQYPPDVIDGAWAPVPRNALGSGGEPAGEEGSAEQLAQG
ncbi:NAD-dependent epimerase/dehydratase family protein [Mycobacterium marseillense]|uniref:NAD-dependent epimerase/dehydratase family protein n=1 Tax=Mycobacterium marseillense TaxID=701042 RepID=UPI00259A602E|nr:NAD-dependent epimerase/dehydratase family protein [Mycobacterium marseillense]MDM3972854.1 NAD-dependent epimerase/dehydratase family protein [Mycobacterium marseillense]